MLFEFWSKPLRPLVHTNFSSKIVLLWVSPKSKSTFYAQFPLVRRIGYRPILCISLKAIGRYHNLKKNNLSILRVRPGVHNTAQLLLIRHGQAGRTLICQSFTYFLLSIEHAYYTNILVTLAKHYF